MIPKCDRGVKDDPCCDEVDACVRKSTRMGRRVAEERGRCLASCCMTVLGFMLQKG